MGNGENGSVRILYSLDNDLKRHNFDDYKEISAEKYVKNQPGNISVSGENYLYQIIIIMIEIIVKIIIQVMKLLENMSYIILIHQSMKYLIIKGVQYIFLN